jgi:ketosteroid isomerase-like protein
MKRETAIRALAVLAVLVVAGLLSAGAVRASDDETQGVRAANDKFYAALNAMFTGDVAPMRDVWSHGDDVTYMGPGGEFTIGWNDVSAKWDAQAALKLGGRVEPKDTRITAGQDMAVASTVEVGHNMDAEGNPMPVEIRATNLFRKENGEWKMIGHHTDLLPFLKN